MLFEFLDELLEHAPLLLDSDHGFVDESHGLTYLLDFSFESGCTLWLGKLRGVEEPRKVEMRESELGEEALAPKKPSEVAGLK